jgi:energy-coupling factor transporter transmembrane protein EcfT
LEIVSGVNCFDFCVVMLCCCCVVVFLCFFIEKPVVFVSVLFGFRLCVFFFVLFCFIPTNMCCLGKTTVVTTYNTRHIHCSNNDSGGGKVL